MGNQFETELTLKDASGSEIASDDGSCPLNSNQAQIVLNNVAAGNYVIELEINDANPTSSYMLSVTGTGITTTTTTASPVESPTTSPTTTTTTTAKPTKRPTQGSGSGSGSNDDSSSDDAASLFFAQNVEEKESDLLGIGNVGDGESEYDLVFDLDKSSWMNLWGIFVLFLLLNALCCVFCFKRNAKNVNEQSFGV